MVHGSFAKGLDAPAANKSEPAPHIPQGAPTAHVALTMVDLQPKKVPDQLRPDLMLDQRIQACESRPENLSLCAVPWWRDGIHDPPQA